MKIDPSGSVVNDTETVGGTVEFPNVANANIVDYDITDSQIIIKSKFDTNELTLQQKFTFSDLSGVQIDNVTLSSVNPPGGGSPEPSVISFTNNSVTFSPWTDAADGQASTFTLDLDLSSPNTVPTVSNPVSDFSVDEDAVNDTFDLTSIFSDSEDADSDLTFSVVSNSNSSLVSASVDNAADQLTLDYQADQNGSADITIRALDSGGLTVDDVFTVTVNNLAPVFSSSSSASFAENGTGTALDVNADNGGDGSNDSGVSYAITGGTDSGAFGIDASTGELTFNSAPDFENPTDSDGQNDYVVDVTADDGASSNNTTTQTITVTVTDANDAPTVTNAVSDFSVDEDAANSTFDLTGIFSDSEDNDGDLTFSVVSNSNSALVTASVDNAADQLTLDYQDDQSGTATLIARATDGGGLFAEDQFAVTVNAVNDRPTITGPSGTLQFDEDVTSEVLGPGNQALQVGDIDAGGSDVEVSLSANHGALELGATAGLTFDSGSNGTGGFTVSGTVTDLNNALVTLSYQSDPDYNGPETIEAVVNDRGNTGADPGTSGDGSSEEATTSVAVNVEAVPDDPTITSIADQSTDEDTPLSGIAFNVGDAETPDASLALAFSVDSPSLIGSHAFGGSGSDRTLTITPSDDQSGVVNAEVTVTDGSGRTALESFQLTINAVNDLPTAAPAISTFDATVEEDDTIAPISFTVDDVESGGAGVTVTASSDNQTLVPSANLAVTDNGGGNRTLDVTLAPDENGTADVTVTLDDGTDTLSDSFTLTVNSANDAPTLVTNQTLTLNEGTASDLTQGLLEATDLEQGASDLTYTIDTDVSHGDLVNTAAPTALGLGDTFTQADINAGSIEYQHDGSETSSDTFDFTVSDGAGGSASGTFSLSITGQNDAPTVGLSTTTPTLAENNAPPTTVAQITVADDASGTNVLSLSGTDASAFQFSGSTSPYDLQFVETANFETTASYEVTVEVDDSGVGGTPDDSEALTLTITNVDETPVFAATGPFSVSEGAPVGASVGDVNATDGDGGATDANLNYSITVGDPSGAFAIDDSGEITVATASAIDFETTSSFSLTVEADDGTHQPTATVTVNVTDAAPSQPTDADSAPNKVAENAANGTAVGVTASSSDPAGGAVTYALTDDADGRFQVDATTGQVTVADGSRLDFETNPSHTIAIAGEDGDGTQSASATVSIAVDDLVPEINVTDGTHPVADGGTFDVGALDLSQATTTTGTLTIENTGGETLTVAAPTIGGAGASVFRVTENPSSPVAPSSSTTLTVQFDPGGARGAYSATLSIDNDDADESPYDVTLTATATAPEIGVTDGSDPIASGGSLDLGSVGVGSSTSQTFTIENTGNATLNIASDALIGSEDFQITTSPAATVAPGGGTTSVIVAYAPSTTGPANATLTIENDDPDEGTYTIDLSGSGTNTSPAFAEGASTTLPVDEDAAATDLGSLLAASDPNGGQTLTWMVTNSPTNGILAGFSPSPTAAAGGSAIQPDGVTYKPAPDVSGTDAFTVEVSDGTATDQLTVNVVVQNLAPVFTNASFTSTVPEGVTGVAYDADATNGGAGDADDGVTYQVGGPDAGSFTLDPAAGTLAFAAPPDFEAPSDADQNNVYKVTVTADDGAAANSAATRTVRVTVADVKEAPTLNAITDQQTLEDTPVEVTASVSDADTPTADLTITASSDNVALLPLSGLTVEGTSADRTLRLVPATDSSGQSTVTVVASDGVQTDTSRFGLTVTPVNDAPRALRALPEMVLRVGDAPLELTELTRTVFRDPEGDPITLASATMGDPSVVSARLDSSVVLLNPQDVGTTQGSVIATDGQATGATAPFPVRVEPASSAPPSNQDAAGFLVAGSGGSASVDLGRTGTQILVRGLQASDEQRLIRVRFFSDPTDPAEADTTRASTGTTASEKFTPEDAFENVSRYRWVASTPAQFATADLRFRLADPDVAGIPHPETVTILQDSTGDGAFHVVESVLDDGGTANDPADDALVATSLPALGTFLFASNDARNLLPVELMAFTAELDGDGATLHWQTASEQNNAGFEVQHRRAGAESFQVVGFVDGAGTTTKPQSYRFRLARLSVGTHSIRLRQVDTDGTSVLTDPVEVTVLMSEPYVLSSYPNPVAAQATVELAVREAQPVRLDLYDLLGRRVATLHDGPLLAGQTKRLTLNAGRLELPSGTYFLRLQRPQATHTQKLTVVR